MKTSKAASLALAGLLMLGSLASTARAADYIWDGKWYALEDGRDNKIFVRRGTRDGATYRQYKNGYDFKLRFESKVYYMDDSDGTREPEPTVRATESILLNPGEFSPEGCALQMDTRPFVGFTVRITSEGPNAK